jgi:hypothetical protein
MDDIQNMGSRHPEHIVTKFFLAEQCNWRGNLCPCPAHAPPLPPPLPCVIIHLFLIPRFSIPLFKDFLFCSLILAMGERRPLAQAFPSSLSSHTLSTAA